ncbi:MAG TPA: hypothetical protein VGI03_15195 [Verrucomicrobiae bacterium]|jgi:hypothetical protein
MNKKRKSVLDPYAKTLLKMDDKKVRLVEMLEWLGEKGVETSTCMISKYLATLRDEREEKALLFDVGATAKQCKQVEAAFEKNPAPELKTLIDLYRVIIWKLTYRKKSPGTTLVLANRLTATVLQFINGQTQARVKEREVALAEQRAAESKKSQGSKALQFCLDETKAFPEVFELFKTAFIALKQAKTK